ncbi:MAG: radical SAM protein [Candidatus Heimdallarchaeaceae archaeon]
MLDAVTIEITSRCNLDCRHCYIGKKENSDLSLETIQNIAEQLERIETRNINLTGGEPFLRQDLHEILEIFSSIANVSISTNGTIYQQLPPKKIRDIQVSVDGLMENHNWLRGDTYELVIENIKKFKKDGHRVLMNTTLFNKNVEDIPSLLELAVELGLDGYRVLSLVPIGNGKKIERASEEDVKKITNFLLSKQLEYNGKILIGLPQYYLHLVEQETGKKIKCSAGMSKICINSIGKVYPCEFLRKEIGDFSNLSGLLRERNYNFQVCPAIGGDYGRI